MMFSTLSVSHFWTAALNANGKWVEYDETTNTVKITSISDFSEAVKTASKGIAAFDQLDGGQGENVLFGYGDGEGAHFDSMLASILKEMGSSYADDYEEDLAAEDALEHTVDYRLNMYSPMYYLLSVSDGYRSSDVSGYFRVNTGIWQTKPHIYILKYNDHTLYEVWSFLYCEHTSLEGVWRIHYGEYSGFIC